MNFREDAIQLDTLQKPAKIAHAVISQYLLQMSRRHCGIYAMDDRSFLVFMTQLFLTSNYSGDDQLIHG